MSTSDSDLEKLDALLRAVPPPPWESVIEGRDQKLGGASFIQTGLDPDRGPDVYVTAGGFEANTPILDLLALARTELPAIIAELRQHRAGQSASPKTGHS